MLCIDIQLIATVIRILTESSNTPTAEMVVLFEYFVSRFIYLLWVYSSVDIKVMCFIWYSYGAVKQYCFVPYMWPGLRKRDFIAFSIACTWQPITLLVNLVSSCNFVHLYSYHSAMTWCDMKVVGFTYQELWLVKHDNLERL